MTPEVGIKLIQISTNGFIQEPLHNINNIFTIC
jgi:hypothetical protein